MVSNEKCAINGAISSKNWGPLDILGRKKDCVLSFAYIPIAQTIHNNYLNILSITIHKYWNVNLPQTRLAQIIN
jgi:hypothetical protein